MEISKLAYELYKEDWKLSHGITREREKREMIRCYNDGFDDYQEYIDDYGYGGQLYVCYEEFLEAEYLDEEYIKWLLDNDEKLIEEYLKDIGSGGEE